MVSTGLVGVGVVPRATLLEGAVVGRISVVGEASELLPNDPGEVRSVAGALVPSGADVVLSERFSSGSSEPQANTGPSTRIMARTEINSQRVNNRVSDFIIIYSGLESVG